MAAKEMCIQNPIVKSQYGEATNPIFEVFYLEDAHGSIADFSGNPPYQSKQSQSAAKSLQADFFFPLHELSIELTGRNSVY